MRMSVFAQRPVEVLKKAVALTWWPGEEGQGTQVRDLTGRALGKGSRGVCWA